MDVRNGDLSVYSSGHQYIIKDIGEDVASELIDHFSAYHDGIDFDAGFDPPDDYDYLIALKHSGIDALVWNAC